MIAILVIFSLVTQIRAYSTFNTNCSVPTTITNYVSEPNTRGTLEILWSCLFTILACTWTVLHLNVPEYSRPDGTSRWSKLKWQVRRLKSPAKWFFLTLLAPEIPIAKYWEDLRKGRKIYKDSKATFTENKWTLTHVMFANMGGFAVKPRQDITEADNQHRPLSQSLEDRAEGREHAADEETMQQPQSDQQMQLESRGSNEDPEANKPKQKPNKYENLLATDARMMLKLLQTGQISELPDILPEELDDRSKSDLFMRVIAVGQILRVLLQIIARAVRGLAVTQLEVGVIAFAGCAVGMYALNWHKPKGVGLPFIVHCEGPWSEVKAMAAAFSKDRTNPDNGNIVIVVLHSFTPEEKTQSRIPNRFSQSKNSWLTESIIVGQKGIRTPISNS